MKNKKIISEILKDIKEKISKFDFQKISLNLFIAFGILFSFCLLFNFMKILPEWINPKIFFILFLATGVWFLIEKIKKIPEEKREKNPLIYVFQYLFLLGLIVIAVNQFLQRQIILDFLFEISALTIAFGLITFYSNRNKVEKEIEDETQKEESKEKKRKEEFSEKFPKINKIPVLRSIVKGMYKEGWEYSIALIGIVVLGFVLRIWLAKTQDFDLDEGIWMYDSLKALTRIPVAEFISRSPILHIFLGNIIRIFFDMNFSVFNGRIIMGLGNMLCVILIYKITKSLGFKKITRIISTILFCFSPFILFWNGYIIKSETINALFILSFIYLIIYARNKKIFWPFFLAGIIIGVDYFIRNSTTILIFCSSIFLLIELIRTKDYKKNILSFLLLIGGFILPIVLIGAIFISKSNLNWTINFLNPISSAFPTGNQQTYTIDYFQLKLSVLSNVWVMNIILFLFFILFLSYVLFKKNQKSITLLVSSLITLYLTINQKFKSGFHLIDITNYFILIPFLIAIVSKIKLSKKRKKIRPEIFLIIGMIFVYSFFYLYSNKIFVSYFSEFIFLLIIPVSFIFNKINFKKNKFWVIFSITAILIMLGGSYFGGNILYERTLQQKDTEIILNQLSSLELTSPILTNQQIFLVEGDKLLRNINDWSRELGAIIEDNTNFNYNYLPFKKDDINSVLKEIKEKNPIIIYEVRTKKLVEKDPAITEYIDLNYEIFFEYKNENTNQEYKILIPIPIN